MQNSHMGDISVCVTVGDKDIESRYASTSKEVSTLRGTDYKFVPPSGVTHRQQPAGKGTKK